MVNDDAFRQPTVDNPYYAPQAAPSEGGTYITRSALTLNPWTSIWLRPRATIRQIVDSDPRYMVIPLAMAGGVVQAFDNASNRNMGDQTPLGVIIAGAVFLGPLGGIVTLYFVGWLLRIVGGWLGGKATPEQTRAAVAWGQVPAICTLLIIAVQIALFGIEIFSQFTPEIDANGQLQMALLATAVVEMTLSIWTMVTFVKCLAEVHQFSAWRGLGTILLAFFLIIGVVMIVVVPIGIIAGARS